MIPVTLVSRPIGLTGLVLLHALKQGNPIDHDMRVKRRFYEVAEPVAETDFSDGLRREERMSYTQLLYMEQDERRIRKQITFGLRYGSGLFGVPRA